MFADQAQGTQQQVGGQAQVPGVPGWLSQLITANAPPDLQNDPDFIRTVAAGAKAESGWDPDRIQQGFTLGSGEGARGLFQFDMGGMGAQYRGNEQALLGQSGAQLQASQIVPLYAQAYRSAPAGLSGADKASWVAAQAERPAGYTDPSSPARQNYAAAYSQIGGGATQAPVAQVPPAQTAMAQSQFGDQQLSTDEAYAACGPAAAVRFAQAYGRNPTLREAVDLARQVGWTPEQGMAGLGSEQKLMSKMGIPTKLVSGAQWDVFAREAQTGNPVTISTPGHYFYADGYNPDTGAFHVGRSGLDLKAGKEWMTPEQMTSLMGQVQGGLLADNPTITAPSDIVAGTADALGSLKRTADAAFTNVQRTLGELPLPKQQALSWFSSTDPQLQQLDQAVANAPNLMAGPAAPAVSPGVGGPTPGGTPPGTGGGGRRGEGEQPSETETGQPQSVLEQARDLIRRFNELPGGTTLSQFSPIDLLPPDFSGLSPKDAVAKAIELAAAHALNRQYPGIGPGGLGLFDPRLGQGPEGAGPLDPFEQLGELLNELRIGRGAEEAASVADRIGAGAGRAQGGQLGANVVPMSASQESLATKLAEAVTGKTPEQGLDRNAVLQVWDNFVRQTTDRNVDLNHIQEELERRVGKNNITDAERLGLLARFDPTNQARTVTEMELGPALRDIPDAAQPDFYDLVKGHTNKSVGEYLADQEAQRVLEGGIPQDLRENLAQAVDEHTSAMDALDEAQRVERAVERGEIRTRESISLDAARNRVQAAQEKVNATSEVARQLQEEAAREEKMTAPGARVGSIPDIKELAIAENDAQRLNNRYDALYHRNPDDPYLETLARQIGRKEDRVSRLRTAMGETTAAREERIGARAEAAAQAARERPTVTATPELAGARVQLRYEQQNLERLQAAQRRGQRGLQDAIDRAARLVDRRNQAVAAAEADLPFRVAAARNKVLNERDFEGGRNYYDVVQNLGDIRQKYAAQPTTLQAMENGLDAVRGLRRKLLQEKVDSGLITQDFADELIRKLPDWTPTRLLERMSDEGPQGLPRGSRIGVNNLGIKKYTAEGSEAAQQNHVASLINEVDKTYLHSNRNRQFNALVTAQGGEGGALKRIANNMAEYNAAPAGSVLPPDYPLKVGEGEAKITGFIDGTKHEYVTRNPYVKAAIQQIGYSPDSVNAIIRALTGVVRTTAVTRNPVFLARNAIRDAVSYGWTTTVRGGVRGLPSQALNFGPAIYTAKTTDANDPERGKKIAAAFLGGVAGRGLLGNRLGLGPSATREFFLGYADALQGLGTTRMTGKGVQDLLLSGAGMRGGTFHAGPISGAEQRLAELTRRDAFSDWGHLLKDAAAFGWVEALGKRGEVAPRVAAMRVAQQQGLSPLQVMARARDVTLDFDRGGRFSKAINGFVPFFNAGVQAGANFGRLWKQDPAGMAVAGLTLVGLPAAAVEEWNNSDPQRARDYANVPQYLKDRGVVIMLPGDAPVDKDGNRKPQHLDIPLGEFAPFATAAREAYDRAKGYGQPRSALSLAGGIGGQLSPITATNPAGATLGTLAVAPIGTAGQLALNRDLYRGGTIANKFSDENASALGKTLAPILENAISRSGIPGASAVRVRPSHVDFAVRDALNGLGTLGLNASDQIAHTPPREPGAPSNIPVVGSAIGSFVRGTGGQSRQDVTSPEAMLAPDIRNRLRDLGGETQYYEPSQVPNEIRKQGGKGIPLREAEQVELQRLTNQYLDQNLRRYLDTASFNGRDVTRKKIIDHAMQQARTKAEAQIIRQIVASGSSLGQRRKQQSSAV